MQQLQYVLPVTTMLMACVGCGGGGGQSADPGGSTAAPTATTTPADPPAPAPAPTPAPTASGKINDTDAAIIYSRGSSKTQNWNHLQPAAEDYQKDEHSSQLVRSGGPISGVGVVVNFSGTGITWI